METRASYILVGAFVVALVVAAFGFVIFLARVSLETGTTPYLINFAASVQGLEVGSKVRYRGVPIGSVSSIKIDPKNVANVRVVVDIDETAPIKEDTVASLALEGITGVASISLTGGTQASPLVKRREGEEYPEIPSRPSTFEKVLEDLPLLLERAAGIAERLSNVLSDENQATFTETLQNLRKITAVVADRSQSLDGILTEATETAAAMRRTAVAAEKLADNLNRRIDPLGDEAQATMGQARQGLTELRKATETFSKVADKLDKMVDENRRPIADFSSTGLYELSQFLTEARTLVANLNQLTLQIQRDPAKFFFGDTQKGYEAK
jgi:phospholipid/cholesterol/gamma-HCH transport system substrate-binding protein